MPIYDFDKMQFSIDRAQEALTDIIKLESAFIWSLTPQGGEFWLEQEKGLTFEGRSTLCYMIAQAIELQMQNTMFARAA